MPEENANTETTETEVVENPETQNANEANETDKDFKAEADKWKALSRKHEERAKANAEAAAELEKIRNESLTDSEKSEKAIENAKAEGRAEALKEVSLRLVDAEFRVASSGRNVNVDALLEGLDRTRFINEEGEVDSEKVKTFIDGLTPQPKTDFGQGPRGSHTKKSTADLFAESTSY